MNFIRYGHSPKAQEEVQETVAPKVIVPESVVMAESTKEVLKEEKIELQETDTVEEVVEQVKKSKKLHAKVIEGGKKVRLKRILKD